MADDEIPDKTAADDLDPAFDSIDATMTNLPPREVSVTPAALAQIVNDAVAKAITAYEQARTEPAEPARGSVAPRESSKPAVPQTKWRAKLEQLQGDMGIGDIEFDGPPAEPAEKIIHRQLSAQMGVHDFEFEDAPGAAAPPDAPTPTDADALAGWATPVPNAAPAATPDVNQTLAPAAAQQIADVAEKFDWIAAELEALGAGTDAKPLAAPPAIAPVIKPVIEPAPKPAPDQTPKAVAPAIQEPPAPKHVTPKQVALEQAKPVTPKEEVRETRSTLASWFRSALADKPQEREPKPAAAMPVAKPAAPTMPVAPPAPAPVPVVTAPPPIVQPPLAEAKPAPDQAAPARPVTPEEAATTTFFTFDPFPPVPPRLPREPKDAPND